MTRLTPSFACLLAVLLVSSRAAFAQPIARTPAGTVPRGTVVELSIPHRVQHANNYLDVTVDVTIEPPGGPARHMKGFYAGGGLWKVRLRPDAPGRWSWASRLTATDGAVRNDRGSFYATDRPDDGLLMRDRRNPLRWQFSSGRPFFPVGLQDCAKPTDADAPDNRIDGTELRDGGRAVSWNEYFDLYGHAGFNLFRFSQKNCSYSLTDDLVTYREPESAVVDALLASAREHGFRVMFGIFGNHLDAKAGGEPPGAFDRLRRALGQWDPVTWAPGDAVAAREKRFIDYAVARWGVYVDIWELLNERPASEAWLASTADYVRTVDPDKKPVTTSWEYPALQAIDVNAPHWYEREDELESDARVARLAPAWKQWGKPVIVGEQGNRGMNWDPRSAVRMRIRTWTALFEEVSFVFWNTSWSKAGMFRGRDTPDGVANIYLGPEERGYIQVLQQYAARFGTGLRMTPVTLAAGQGVRAYGLSNAGAVGVYLHHYASHTTTADGVRVTLTMPASAQVWHAEWREPATGRVVSRADLAPGLQTIDVPSFEVDLALLVTP